MAKITLAQQLATTLEQAGVKRIWGLTGMEQPTVEARLAREER